MLLLAAITLIFPNEARAVPSFARQTGLACNGCHVGTFGPQLNAFGRQFKLNGYVSGPGKKLTSDIAKYLTGDAQVRVPPLSAMVIASWTHTAGSQPGGAAPGFGNNDNASLDQVGLFYAGRIYGKLGAMIQGTYDGVAKHWTIDNVDIRLANQGLLADKALVYGLTVNNNPTVQDLWNSSPA
jgi:hypothetical protein